MLGNMTKASDAVKEVKTGESDDVSGGKRLVQAFVLLTSYSSCPLEIRNAIDDIGLSAHVKIDAMWSCPCFDSRSVPKS